MNILAAAQSQPAQQMPAQSVPGYQNTTVQPDRPVYKPSAAAKAFSWSILIAYVAIIIFFIVMTYRFVRAAEKIADGVQKGIGARKDDSTT